MLEIMEVDVHSLPRAEHLAVDSSQHSEKLGVPPTVERCSQAKMESSSDLCL